MRRVFVDEVGSTNTFLKDLCRNGAQHGTAVYSWNQLSGYGRRGKFWFSEPDKNIALSIALKPPPDADFVPFSIVAGVAVHEALSPLCPNLAIKWPNDILADGRKFCGISCERIFTQENLYIIGIGVNVNNTEFPGDLADSATSLLAQTGAEWDLHQILDKILGSLYKYYDLLLGGGFADILNIFRQHCQNIWQNVTIFHENRQISGIAVDIADDGCIVLHTEAGDLEKFSSGEVSLR